MPGVLDLLAGCIIYDASHQQSMGIPHKHFALRACHDISLFSTEYDLGYGSIPVC